MPRPTLHRAAILSVLTLGPVAACKLTTSPLPDLTLCQQTSELANSGCARLRGIVLDPGGRPMELVQLTLRVDSTRSGGPYGAGVVTTGADGNFGLQLTRFSALTGHPSPDTVTARLVYAVPDSVSLRTYTLDSLNVLLHFVPPGQRAVVDTVTVRLQARTTASRAR